MEQPETENQPEEKSNVRQTEPFNFLCLAVKAEEVEGADRGAISCWVKAIDPSWTLPCPADHQIAVFSAQGLIGGVAFCFR
jgi:hypothetical protein